jgi:hypothetical protein
VEFDAVSVASAGVELVLVGLSVLVASATMEEVVVLAAGYVPFEV